MIGNSDIHDPARTVVCSECGHKQTVINAVHALGCTGCAIDMCVYCGCTEQRACVEVRNGKNVPCGWAIPGICTFCAAKCSTSETDAVVGSVDRMMTPAVYGDL